MVDRIKVTPRLRDAAPDLCEQIDDLRKNRRSSLNRHSYLKNGGKEVEAAEELQRIKEIDATIAPLLAAAKEQLLKGTANDLSQQAALLQVATSDRQQIRATISEKIEQHAEEMRQLIEADRDLDCAVEQSMHTMDAAARQITGCAKEQEGADAATPTAAGSAADTNQSTPARSSTDIQYCDTKCNGARGLASHLRQCKNMDVQAPSEAVGTKFKCPTIGPFLRHF